MHGERGYTMLTPNNTAFVLIDFQGRLAEVMYESDLIRENLKTLIKGLQLLDVPTIWVEQYPKGLGPTVDDVKELLIPDYEPIAKMDFSACQHDDVQNLLAEYDRENYIVAGIEAHVCVYQTVRELLAAEKYVEFVEDCISSRTKKNKQIAINKMSLLGAYPTSVEMILFELMKTAEHPNFREISSLIK